MRWCFLDGSAKDREYAASVLDALQPDSAIVPAIWTLEVANVLVRAERYGSIPRSTSETFLEKLASLDITADAETSGHALSDTLQLARAYKLSAYDASYLELALRLDIPLATLDEKLLKAARKAGVKKFG